MGNTSKLLSKNHYTLFIICIISILVIFLTPYGFSIDLGPGPNSLMAILWEYRNLSILRWFTVLEYVPYYFFRFIAVYYLIRYISDVVSIKKTIIMVIISELIPLLISIPGILFLNSEGENFIPIMISIPILLLYNVILIFTFSHRKINLKDLKSV